MIDPIRMPAALLAALLALGAPAVLAQSDAERSAQTESDGESEATPAGEAPAASPDTVIATVNGRDITEADLALVPPPQGMQGASPEQRRAAALTRLIDLRAVAAVGERDGVADEAFERTLALIRDQQIAGEVLRRATEAGVTDELLRRRYDEEVAGAPRSEEVRASHILVETEEEARAVIAELDGGADFAELAKERSTGPSGPNGGDLGFFGPGRMVPAFDAAARALEVGSYSKEPVQTQFGFHVINVTDKREIAPPPFEAVREQVANIVGTEVEAEAVRAAREEATVEIRDEGLAALIEEAKAQP